MINLFSCSCHQVLRNFTTKNNHFWFFLKSRNFLIKSYCKIHKEVVLQKSFAGVAVSILTQLIFLKFAQTLLFLWDMRPHEGLKSGTGATFSIANKWSNKQKTNRLKNVSIRVQYTKDACFSYKNTIGATCSV